MAERIFKTDGTERCEAETYTDLLLADSKTAPAGLLEQKFESPGTESVSTDHYTSQEYFDLEVEKMWSRVWQFACREEEIPNVGDTHVYENVGKSFLIVRTAEDEIKAYYNSCLHRGRKLRTENGCVDQLRCPYHGFTWNLDGSLKEIPCKWDFAHLEENKMGLPEVSVGTWGGFVFINEDDSAIPLMEWLEIIPKHFDAHWPQEERYKAIHVAKVVHCNWKACAEAFMESFHVIDTHPQLMEYLADANSQYDIYGKYSSRQISALGVQSPHLPKLTEQEIFDAMTGQPTRGVGENPDGIELPGNKTARAFLGDMARANFEAMTGHDHSEAADAEVLDSILYNAFPNISIWGGHMPNIVYRWRPNGMDVDSCIMDVMMLHKIPKEGPRPEAVPCHFLGEDEAWTDAPEITGLAEIFEQDMANLPHVQTGLKASKVGQVQLANYQEGRIRLLHRLIDEMIND